MRHQFVLSALSVLVVMLSVTAGAVRAAAASAAI